jgi:hypothetical protein
LNRAEGAAVRHHDDHVARVHLVVGAKRGFSTSATRRSFLLSPTQALEKDCLHGTKQARSRWAVIPCVARELAIEPIFWGQRVDLNDACARIRRWIARRLLKG